ncbi:MAG: hypothetical protein NZ482_01895 [Gloeomargarita sp. SKYG98]|nr:hypothetical protein [Gloeomargarita sp. SKYG98]
MLPQAGAAFQWVLDQALGQESSFEFDPERNPAEQAGEQAFELVNRLWEQVGHSQIYEGILLVAKILLGIGLIFVAYRVYTELADNKYSDFRKVIAAFIWPIIAILLLVEPPNLNNQVITRNTNIWQIALTLRNTANLLTKVAVEGLYGNVENPVSVYFKNTSALDELAFDVRACQNQPANQAVPCLEAAAKVLKDSKNPFVSGLSNDFLNSLQQIGLTTPEIEQATQEWQFLENNKILQILGHPFATFGRSVVEPILRKILFGLYLMFALLIEITLLLVAIVAPLAVGLSLLPLSPRSIVLWLAGFLGVMMTKISFHVLASLGVAFGTSSEYGGFNVAVAMLIALGAPFMAGAVGSFSAQGIIQGAVFIGGFAIGGALGAAGGIVRLGSVLLLRR